MKDMNMSFAEKPENSSNVGEKSSFLLPSRICIQIQFK